MGGQSHNQIGVLIQCTYSVFLLIPKMLLNRLVNWVFDLWTFALNNHNRNTIDKQYNIRTVMLATATSKYTKLFRYVVCVVFRMFPDRKSTRLNSSHVRISYAVFCL